MDEHGLEFPPELIAKYGDRGALLGDGSFSEVYVTTKGYAVKVLEDEGYDNYGSGMREAGLMLNLQSSNERAGGERVRNGECDQIIGERARLMPLLDHFATEKAIFLVMPKGERLEEPQLNDVRGLFHQVCCGVADLHSRDIVHRDLKPQNCIKLGDRVVIADFGVSRAETSMPYLAQYQRLFTLEYRSPENLLGGWTGKHSDVWALGIMLYQWLTGITPFNERTTGERVRAQREDERIVDEENQEVMPPEDEPAMVKRMFEELGPATEANWPGVTRLIRYPHGLAGEDCKGSTKRFFRRIEDSEARDLLKKILVMNPGGRLTIYEILDHPYMKGISMKTPVLDLWEPPSCLENLRRFLPTYFIEPASLDLNPNAYRQILNIVSLMTLTARGLGVKLKTLNAAIILFVELFPRYGRMKETIEPWTTEPQMRGSEVSEATMLGMVSLSISDAIYEDYPNRNFSDITETLDMMSERKHSLKIEGFAQMRADVLRLIGFRTLFTTSIAFSDLKLRQLGLPGKDWRTYDIIAKALLNSRAVLELSIEELGDLISESFIECLDTGQWPDRMLHYTMIPDEN